MTEPRPDELPLEARLAAARKRAAGDPDPRQVAGSALARGSRHALELVAGVLVGAGLGYWLDGLTGSSPVFLIGGFLLGLAAGFTNLLRVVQAEQAKFSQTDLEALPVVEDDEEEV